MERDFMGLAVKQEISDEAIDAAPLRSAAMQWPYSDKTYAHHHPQPQQMLTDKPKTGFDSLASAGLVTITTTPIHSHPKSLMQKNIKQGGARYTVTNQHDFSNQTKTMTVSPASLHQPFVATAAHHVILPFSAAIPVVGTSTDLRNAPKISSPPAQLTIFYNGSVCVYDNVSAEKAQAIMLLAGNAATPAAPVEASTPTTPTPCILESFAVSHPAAISQSVGVGWSGAITDMTASKQGTILVSSNKVEPMKLVTSSTFLPSSTVPQFRRKSLARFLEKRKERVINAAPYVDQESAECNSCPVPAAN